MGISSILLLAIVTGSTLVMGEEEATFVSNRVVRLDCNSCGNECTASCGTKLFRTCCLSFARKRSSDPVEVSDDSITASDEDRHQDLKYFNDDSIRVSRYFPLQDDRKRHIPPQKGDQKSSGIWIKGSNGVWTYQS